MANIITGCRIVCSIFLLCSPVFSNVFYILYLLAGFTDMVDGLVARKTNNTTRSAYPRISFDMDSYDRNY